MDSSASDSPDFFISRAGKHPADVAMASKIGHILEQAGHRVFLEQWDFANRNFMERMDTGLASGARVISVLTPEYIRSDYCAAEWMHTLHGDPLNRRARLIVFRCSVCEPQGLLRTIGHWDLASVCDNDELLAEVVQAAILPDAQRRQASAAHTHWRQGRALIHHDIRPTGSFTGRETELVSIGDALRSAQQGAAAITQPAAVTGLGGIGKSTLAREYAWQAQADYAGVWWLNAERSGAEGGWDGIEQGLVELGDQYIPGLARAKNRQKAALHALDFLGNGGFAKPWLLVFDNVDDPRALELWRPQGNVKTLITSRLGGWGGSVASIEIEQWPMADAVKYLLAEADRPDLTEDDARRIADDLGCLPLALSHAAAYLRDNKTATAASYRKALHAHMREVPPGVAYSRAVYATFVEQVAQAERRAPGAGAVLSLAAFFAPEDVPEELFTQSPQCYPLALADVVADPLALEKALGALDKLSLIDFSPQARTFTIHRLVQSAARDALDEVQGTMAQHAVFAVYSAFPEFHVEDWSLCERLVAHSRTVAAHVPPNESTRELAWLLGATAQYLQERVSLFGVLPLRQHSRAIYERLAQSDPGNAGWQRDLSVSQEKIGDVLQVQGNLSDALAAYQASLAIAERLAQSEPGNAGWQRGLSVSHNKIGNVLQVQGNLSDALAAYQASLAIRERLAQSDPGNAGWQRDLSVSHNNIGDVLKVQGNLSDALAAYQAVLAIRERLAQSDPGNAGWQRDLSVSHNNIGDVLKVQGNLSDALAAYQAGLAIRERLAQSDPGNAGWQRDLSVSQEKIGEVLQVQGNLSDALAAYQAGLAIRERLAQADPGNAGWQRDVALSYGRVAVVEGLSDEHQDAMHRLRAGRDIIARLSGQSPDNAILRNDLAWFDQLIADARND